AVAALLQRQAKGAQIVGVRVWRCRTEEPDHRNGRLLRARRQRRRRRDGAEEPDELAAFPLTRMHRSPQRPSKASQDIGLTRISQRVRKGFAIPEPRAESVQCPRSLARNGKGGGAAMSSLLCARRRSC